MWVLDDKILFSNANGEGCRVALTKTSNSGRTNACHLREVVGKDVGDMGDMGKELFAQRYVSGRNPGVVHQPLPRGESSRRTMLCRAESMYVISLVGFQTGPGFLGTSIVGSEAARKARCPRVAFP